MIVAIVIVLTVAAMVYAYRPKYLARVPRQAHRQVVAGVLVGWVAAMFVIALVLAAK